ncbi:hypothetical protein [Nocardioides mangrovi]|uniref:Uncharacterized protein n=1 Tax=Nocardioides mangrovi TaxID=2874580 RepID=A0ABS7UGV6_9ACTN|nr:hypothetical protein [Nocardioides mangrovi]MBZ5740236.1 hypothetical protein [Nocardioides mangrovi]
MTSVTQQASTRLGCAFVAAAVSLIGWLPVPGTSDAPSDGAQRPRSSYGHTRAPDGTLRPGCHNYRYHYRVNSPTHDWTLETFLRDPRHDGLASGVFATDSDPTSGPAHFRFCRYSTKPGRFTIKAHLHWYNGSGEDHDVWLEPSHFRLSRR